MRNDVLRLRPPLDVRQTGSRARTGAHPRVFRSSRLGTPRIFLHRTGGDATGRTVLRSIQVLGARALRCSADQRFEFAGRANEKISHAEIALSGSDSGQPRLFSQLFPAFANRFSYDV